MPHHQPLRDVVLEVTNRCNLRCPHCASSSGEARPHEMTLDEIRGVLRGIADLGGERVAVIGGEALLRADCFDICQAVKDVGMHVVLITNGITLRQDEQFARLRHLRPHVIGISVDGATRESYRAQRGVDAFDHVLGACRRLLDEGHTDVNAITTFSRRNLGEFDRFVELFQDSGITWQVQMAHKAGDRFCDDDFLTVDDFAWLTARMRDILVHRLDHVRLRPMDDFGYFPLDPALKFLHHEWAGCQAGNQVLGIRAHGDVLGCLSLGDEFVEANLRQVSLSEIWRSDRYFQRFRRKEELLCGECALCAFRRECRAGCTGVALSSTGHIGCNTHCIRSIETTGLLAQLEGLRSPPVGAVGPVQKG